MKTVYIFYLVFEKSLNPQLYAYTDNKKYAELFRTYRNMNVFKEKEFKLDKNGWLSLNSIHPNNKITIDELETKGRDEFTKDTIKLPLTYDEVYYVTLKPDEIIDEKFKNIMINPSVFNSKINESLYALGYFYIYRNVQINFYANYDLDSFYDGFDRETIGLKPSYMDIDQFTIFMERFGYTINTQKGDK